MHITLTGNLGSGKSTICRILESKYGYTVYSTGRVLRDIAEEKGVSVLEMNRLMCTDPKYDKMIDEAVARISREKKQENLVFDSRLAWFFAEDSFKVFLSVGLSEAAKRVYADSRGSVEAYASVEEAEKQLKQRAQTEDARYKELYQIAYFNLKNYHFVIDSTYLGADFLAETITKEAERYEAERGRLGEGAYFRMLLSPKSLDASLGSFPYQHGIYEEALVSIKETDAGFVPADLPAAKTVQKAAADGYALVSAVL